MGLGVRRDLPRRGDNDVNLNRSSFNRSLSKFKSGFFDRKAVIRSVEAGRLNGLSRFGGLVRKTAQRSMRKRKKSSAPGKPPSVHEGSVKRLLFYAYDSGTRSVVAGPVGFAPSKTKLAIGGTVPEVLEKGGAVGYREQRLSGGLWVRWRKRYSGHPERTRIVPQAARPFMAPALKTTAPKFPGFFSNVVR